MIDWVNLKRFGDFAANPANYTKVEIVDNPLSRGSTLGRCYINACAAKPQRRL